MLAAIPLVLLLFAGLGLLLQWLQGGPVTSSLLHEWFFPPHDVTPGRDPFATIEVLLGRLTEVGRSLSLVAVPAFLWFSTRLFAGVRTALNSIYDVGLRPPKGHFVVRFLLAKLRDLGMVFLTLTLFLASTALSLGFTFLRAYLEATGGGAIIRTLEGWLAQLLSFAFLLVLFFLLYRYASLRRVRWQAALVAAGFMAVAFEIAKRLYGLYLRGATGYGVAVADATTGAIILFVIWVYYSALVFLLGGVVAETWELRELQRVQRGGMARSTATANVPVEAVNGEQ